jgi:uncharacterized membrane protein YuzA (DUF378 family)
MKAIHVISFILVAIGGLNWGLIGLGGFFGSNWNLVGGIFGAWPQLLWIVYILVGIATIILICTHKKNCSCCSKSASSQPTM